MSGQWQLQDAKNRFSQMLDKASREGPQTVTRRGVPAAVVVSIADYRRLCKRESNLVDFLCNSPLQDVELDLQRSKDLPRKVEL